MRRAALAVLLGLHLVLGAPPLGPPSPAPAAAEDEPTLGVQVNRAIARGVEWLKRWQNPDGSFRGPYHDEYPVGQTAFALYALAKSQVPAEDPVVQKALAFLKGHDVRKTYEAAALILALDAMKDAAFDDRIRGTAWWIEQHVNAKEGVWSYPFGPTRDHSLTDLSNTQFATLGLWIAEAHGYRSSRDLWERLARVVPDYQTPYGAFFYATNRSGRQGNGSMTTAGLTVLTLALDRISGNEQGKPYVERAAKSLAKGWEYLEKHFRVDANPDGAFAATEGSLYYLYGLERVAALADKRKIGGHDWYAEGARYLLSSQHADGGWGDPTEAACYALLFLRQATATRMGREGAALEGAGVAPPAPAFQRPQGSVPFVSRWLLLGPFENADDSGLSTDSISEANVAPRAGLKTEKGTWSVWRSTHPYVLFREALGAKPHSLSYAFTWLHASKDADVVLWLGHHDGARVILDGKTIHDTHLHAPYDADRWSVPVRLAAGPHRLLFKVEENTPGNGAWLRVTHPDGSEATEIAPSIWPEGPDLQDVVGLKPNAWSLADLLRMLPPDREPNLDFDRPEDLDRVVVTHCYEGMPRWFKRPESKPGQPHPGAFGILAVHPESQAAPVSVIRRLRLPTGFPFVRLRASADPYENPKRTADFLLKVSVFDGASHPLLSQIVEAGPPSPDGWRTFDVDLRAFAGKDVLLVLEAAAGGKEAWWNEEAFFDEISVGTALR